MFEIRTIMLLISFLLTSCHFVPGGNSGGTLNSADQAAQATSGQVGALTKQRNLPEPQIMNFTIIDADTDIPVQGFENVGLGRRVTYDLAQGLPPNITVRANPNIRVMTTRSVNFTMEAAGQGAFYSRMENTAPFALFGDTSSDFLPSQGEFQITAGGIAYAIKGRACSGTNGRGACNDRDAGLVIIYLDSSLGSDTIPPSIPTGVEGEALSPTSIRLSWNPSTDNVGVEHYKVYRNGIFANRVDHPTTTFTDNGLTPATSYSYTVSAHDAAGNASTPSNPISISTQSQGQPSSRGQVHAYEEGQGNMAGIIVVDVEDIPSHVATIPSNWEVRQHSGARGSGALEYRGTDYFNKPGYDWFRIPVKINSPGHWVFCMRSKIALGSNHGEHNDSWVKIVGGRRDMSNLPNAAFQHIWPSDGYQKAYMNHVGGFKWQTSTVDESTPPFGIASLLDRGLAYIDISARSRHHAIDRVALFRVEDYPNRSCQSLQGNHAGHSFFENTLTNASESQIVAVDLETTLHPVTVHNFPSQIRVNHPTAFYFNGDQSFQQTGEVNPALDRRIIAKITKNDLTYYIRGYWSARSDVVESEATSGNKFRVNFNPPEEGQYQMAIHFASGDEIFVRDEDNFDPANLDYTSWQGNFTVLPSNINRVKDLRRADSGFIVQRTDKRFYSLRTPANSGSDQSFIIKGKGSPENILAQTDIAGTTAGKVPLLHMNAMRQDFDPVCQDLTWSGNKGRGIMGWLAYHSDLGVNSQYLVTYNTAGVRTGRQPAFTGNVHAYGIGDGHDVFIHHDRSATLHLNAAKLAQWSNVFECGYRLGMHWNVFTFETEVDYSMDGGNWDIETKFYIRHLMAALGHYSVRWNVGEENVNTNSQRLARFEGFYYEDPYQQAEGSARGWDRPRTIHAYPGQYSGQLDFVRNNNTSSRRLATGLCIQEGDILNPGPWGYWFNVAKNVTTATINQGFTPIASEFCESGRYDIGVPGRYSNNTSLANQYWPVFTSHVVWGSLLGSSVNVSAYSGYSFGNVGHAEYEGDLRENDGRKREGVMENIVRAVDYMNAHVPHEAMRSTSSSLDNRNDVSVMYWPGTHQVVLTYVMSGEVQIKLKSGTYTVEAFNPMTGDTVSLSNVTGTNNLIPVPRPSFQPYLLRFNKQ